MKPEQEPVDDYELKGDGSIDPMKEAEEMKGDGSIDPMEAAENDLNPMPEGPKK